MSRILWKASPFFKARGSNPLDMVVIHHIGSKNGKIYSIEGTITWFTDTEVHRNKETGKIENAVSAHYAIPREAHTDYDIVQFVKDTDVAYHAGDSQWAINGKTRKYINQYSIGIELEGDGNVFEYTDFQYDTLISLVKDLMSKHNIPEQNIVGHEDISPGRKVDPGKLFDWKRLRQGVAPTISVISTPPISSGSVAPSATPSAAPPSPPAPKMPDDQFYMGGGKNKDGKRPNFLIALLQAILQMFVGASKKS
jgi:AmpD protein